MKTDAPVNASRIVLSAFLAALLMKVFLFDFVIADGRSMVPAIHPGTVLVVNRLAYGIRFPGTGKYLFRWSLPKAGDVVIFLTPQGQIAVKRCGTVVGKEDFFALGDNSLESYDSRSYGPVPADSVVGKVMGIK
ncbi:MAG: S26 family signal peptidase [Treponema sp.]|jgi:signal peptidase I|nr:S26 family signal peptidase [Treponema sp.]